MSRVFSTHYKNIHYYAKCEACSFDVGISLNDDEADVRRKIKHHVKETGHNATLITGSETEYNLEV